MEYWYFDENIINNLLTENDLKHLLRIFYKEIDSDKDIPREDIINNYKSYLTEEKKEQIKLTMLYNNSFESKLNNSIGISYNNILKEFNFSEHTVLKLIEHNYLSLPNYLSDSDNIFNLTEIYIVYCNPKIFKQISHIRRLELKEINNNIRNRQDEFKSELNSLLISDIGDLDKDIYITLSLIYKYFLRFHYDYTKITNNHTNFIFKCLDYFIYLKENNYFDSIEIIHSDSYFGTDFKVIYLNRKDIKLKFYFPITRYLAKTLSNLFDKFLEYSYTDDERYKKVFENSLFTESYSKIESFNAISKEEQISVLNVKYLKNLIEEQYIKGDYSWKSMLN